MSDGLYSNLEEDQGLRSLDIAVRSFSSPDAARVLREVLMEDFVTPLTKKKRDVSAVRATLVAAFLGGFGILRDVVAADSLRTGDPKELETALYHILDDIMVSDATERAQQSANRPSMLDDADR